jgi:hypothetical protein
MALAMAIGSQEFPVPKIDLNPSLVYFAQVIPCINSCKIIPIVKVKPTKKGFKYPLSL